MVTSWACRCTTFKACEERKFARCKSVPQKSLKNKKTPQVAICHTAEPDSHESPAGVLVIVMVWEIALVQRLVVHFREQFAIGLLRVLEHLCLLHQF